MPGEPEGAAGTSARLIAIGDSTIVVGSSWDSILEESFDDGKVLSSTPIGVRPSTWRVDGDQLSDAVEVAAGGAVLDIAWTRKLFVAVGLAEIDSSELAVWTSVDGTTWSPSPIPDLPPGIETDGFESVTVSGTGTVVAMADMIGDDQHAIAFVTTDTTEWSIANVTDVAFVESVGTDWGFVAGANERGAWEDRLLVASADGENWTIVSRPEAFILGSGVSTPSGVFMSGRSPEIDGAGIWVITTP